MIKLSSAAAAVVAVLMLASCSSPKMAQSTVSVIVDLSGTWNNEDSRVHNTQLLTTVSDAIVTGASSLPRPMAIRYHAIGAGSLGRPALCTADYRRKMFRSRADQSETHFFTTRDSLQEFLDQCAQRVAASPMEMETDIATAVVTAQRATGLAPGARHVFILLSDFKADRAAPEALAPDLLNGSSVVLIYRTLPEDKAHPAGLDARITAWTETLRRAGARVVVAFDEGAVESPRQLSEKIFGPAK